MSLPLVWLGRRGSTLIAGGAIRSFNQGAITVMLGVYLAEAGFSVVAIGAYFSAGAAGAAIFSLALAFVSERFRRRDLLVLFSLLAAMGVGSLALTTNVAFLAAFALMGSVTGDPGGSTGPTQPLLQASLAESAPADKRTETFGLYRIVQTLSRAGGALAASIPVGLAALGIAELTSFRVVFAGLAVLLIAMAGLFATLPTPATETARPRWTNPLKTESRRTIFTLTGLFTVDALGGALLLRSLIAYWFSTRFGLDLTDLALVFFGSELLSAASLWLATRLATRIGLINTMVFTHLPASFLLLGAAFAPSAWLAVTFWQARSLFSLMDIPARDSYTMAVVRPEERVAMASIHNLGRSAANTAGPSIATALWTTVSASAPLVGCAVLKIGYDLSLWYMFRNAPSPEEAARRTAAERQRRVR